MSHKSTEVRLIYLQVFTSMEKGVVDVSSG